MKEVIKHLIAGAVAINAPTYYTLQDACDLAKTWTLEDSSISVIELTDCDEEGKGHAIFEFTNKDGKSFWRMNINWSSSGGSTLKYDSLKEVHGKTKTITVWE